MRTLRWLSVVAAALAFVVIVVGAYVRLSDAGLGCPDWPFCYGKPVPAAMADAAAHGKAWKEMGHRYLAGSLGLVILGLALLAFAGKKYRRLSSAIVLLVLFQATLGMWTVTMLLKPAIVTSHLLGGMAIFALLIWLALSQFPFSAAPQARALSAYAALALAAMVLQVALGGWVSANYAALACPDLPGCRGEALPTMDFANAFHVFRELGRTGEGDLLPLDALVAIHWTHRMFALAVFAAVSLAAWKAFAVEGLRGLAGLVVGLLVLQISLGVANVALGLPLPLAAAHNAGAALLLGALIVLNFFAFRGLRPSSEHPGS
jgi:cytochrome c oxidase assembly protein subunit 15